MAYVGGMAGRESSNSGATGRPAHGLTGRLLLLCSAIAMAACATSSPAEDGGTVFYASGADLQSINPLLTVHPLAKQVERYVLFLPLAAYDSTLMPAPRLAQDWVWSRDRTQLTFHLRRDVRWHDDVPVSADDVVWTLKAARDPAVAYPRARDLAALTQVERVDQFTARLTFARAQPTFPDVLTDLALLPAHRLEGLEGGAIRTARFNQFPVGDGPFQFVEHRPNQRWVFRRFDSFPEALGRPRISRLVIVVVDEATTKLAALTSGELDVAGIAPQHTAFVRRDDRLRVLDYPIQLVYALIFNTRRPPFDDPQLRRALSLAIDRRLIVDAYLYGYGTVADGPAPPEHPWHEPMPAPVRDSAQASRLLDAAGWLMGPDGVRRKGGRPLAFTVLTVTTGENALEQMLQAQLKEVGAAMTIRPVELSTFLGLAQGELRDFDALVTGLPGDLALSSVASLLGGRGPLAYPGYDSKDVRAALQRVREATTERQLADGWRDIQRLLARDMPVAWLYHARGVQGVNRRVEGITMDLRGELAGVDRWWIPASARRH
jgi:peptide/nickel transport system substrate-binding protein